MDTASDELLRPLGLAARGRPPDRRARLYLAGSAAVLLTIAAGVALVAYRPDASTSPPARLVEADRPASPPSKGQLAPAAPDRKPADPQPGITVTRPNGAAGPLVITLPDEPSRTGALSGGDAAGAAGRRGAPLSLFARPAGELPGGAVPKGRIALVIGGLGLGREATDLAISTLPAGITLAFAPYGATLAQDAERARAAGHELMLQAPMEPFDYPANDPGPHTLTVAAKPVENLDRFRWTLGRLDGYVGIMTYQGAKFTANERALAPILREAGDRGLGVLDDGSSARSMVTALAGSTRAARASAVIDANPKAELIDKALARLETEAAASDRIVVASASALPVTLERVGRWSRDLASRGLLLVPISAALMAEPSPGPAR